LACPYLTLEIFLCIIPAMGGEMIMTEDGNGKVTFHFGLAGPHVADRIEQELQVEHDVLDAPPECPEEVAQPTEQPSDFKR